MIWEYEKNTITPEFNLRERKEKVHQRQYNDNNDVDNIYGFDDQECRNKDDTNIFINRFLLERKHQGTVDKI